MPCPSRWAWAGNTTVMCGARRAVPLRRARPPRALSPSPPGCCTGELGGTLRSRVRGVCSGGGTACSCGPNHAKQLPAAARDRQASVFSTPFPSCGVKEAGRESCLSGVTGGGEPAAERGLHPDHGHPRCRDSRPWCWAGRSQPHAPCSWGPADAGTSRRPGESLRKRTAASSVSSLFWFCGFLF